MSCWRTPTEAGLSNGASLATKVVAHWRTQPRLKLGKPVRAEALDTFEREHHVRLPAAVRELYAIADGFAPPDDVDDRGFHFWQLRDIRSVTDYDAGRHAFPGADAWFLFADYLDWSWAYSFRATGPEDAGPVSAVGTADAQPLLIADSFEAFIEFYLADGEALYAAGGPSSTSRE